MKRLIFAILFLGLAVSAYAADEHQAIADFMRAGDLYKQGDYSGSIAAYRKILDEGFESGELYYNLGNACHRDGQTGCAALNYERAAQLIPRDRDLKFNYRYLISRHPDMRQDREKNFIEKAVDKHIEFYTLDEMAAILFALFIVFGLVWPAAFHWRWTRMMVILVSVPTFVMFAVFAAGFAFKIADLKGKAAAVRKTSANFEPRKEATGHFQVPEGAIIKILKEEDGWVKIRRFDNKQGWVPSDSVERVER